MREILNTGEDERTGVAYRARAETGTEERAAEVVTGSKRKRKELLTEWQ